MKAAIFSFIMIISFQSFSQTKDSLNEVIVGKFTVKVVINDDNSYGYKISDSENLILIQKYRPYFTVPEGFKISNNALIVGKWNAQEMLKDEKIKNIFIPVSKAKELGVTDLDLHTNANNF